ncbi:RibD family protein [Pseudorhodoferax sp. Leaf267]|uniref:RibD family protein n=1 Tax=Pseudorhodoferax sp. Leaf267 TaxID=1736316 RepID=UPI001F2B46FA|nr:RibD family protein [Pseudorhodoferax sp. Leaf267]
MLDIAQRRRRGLPPTDARLPLHWSAHAGYALPEGWHADAQSLFALFKPLLDRRGDAADWTIGQLGQSLDGCIATHTGDACFVNGPEGLVHLHRLRALCDAVVVGASTACLDNPQLTTRRVPGPNPTRVVLDPRLRVPADAKLFRDGQAPTLLVCHAAHRTQAEARLGADRVVALPAHPSGGAVLALPAVLAALRARGLRTLFIEGGGVTVSQFVQQGLLDRLHLIVAPVLIGAGHPGLRVKRSDAMADALRPPVRTFALGGDVLWDMDLRA